MKKAMMLTSGAMTSGAVLSGRWLGRAREVPMRYLILFLIAGLAACATEPRRVSATNPTVTYAVDGRNGLSTAESMAADYCNGFGQSAHLRGVTEQSGTSYATFDCV
jgi:hypothetical protein